MLRTRAPEAPPGPPPPPPATWRRRTGYEPFLAAILLVLAFGSLWSRFHVPSPGIDFYQFWLVGHALRHGSAGDVYSPEGREALARLGSELVSKPGAADRLRAAVQLRPRVETFSTPLLYSLFYFAGSGDYEHDYDLWELSSVLLASAAVIFLALSLGHRPTTAFLLLAAVLLGFKPLLSDVQVGNVAGVQLALLVACAGSLRWESSAWRPLVSGAAAAFLILFKPDTVLAFTLLGLSWVFLRRWTIVVLHLAGAAAGTLAAIALSVAAFGSTEPWLRWMRALPAIERESDLSVAAGNYSLSRFVTESGGRDPAIAILLALACLVLLAVWRGRPRVGVPYPMPPYRRNVLVLSLGCAIALAGAPLVWLHYYILSLPLIVFLMSPEAVRGWWRIPLAAAVLLVFGAPIDVLRWSGPSFPALEMFAGIGVLCALGIAALWRTGGPEEASAVAGTGGP